MLIPSFAPCLFRSGRLRYGILAIVLTLFVSQSTKAADAAWNVNTDGAWSLDSNWNPAAAPGVNDTTIVSPDVATFGTIITAGRVVTVDSNRNVAGINFAGNSSAYTLSGGNLLLTSGGTLQTSGGGSNHTDLVSSAITLGGDYTFATNSTTVGRVLSIGTSVTSAATSGITTLTLEGIGTSNNNAITGGVSNGTGSNQVAIVKNGAGNWTLSGSNNFTGDVTVNAGTLRGTSTPSNTFSAFGTGNTINLNGGTLQLLSNGTGNNQTIVASNNVTTGSSAVTINVNNNGANAQSNISLSNLSLGTGQLNLTGGNQYNLRFSGTTTLTGNATINSTSSGVSLVGVVSESGGSFGLTKLGAASSYVSTQVGNITLSGANTYTGVTSVLEGILVLNGAAPSGAAGTLGNATSDVLLGNTSGSVNAYLMANNYTIARNITVQSGNSGTAFLGSASTSGSGIYSGNVTLGSAGGTGHGVTLVSGAYHGLEFSGVIQDPVGLTGAGGVVTIGSTSTANFLTGTFSPNPTNGSSIITLSGANTYTGGTVINTTGAVRISNASAFGTGSLSIVAGTIQGNGVAILAGISGQTWDGNFALNSFSFGAQGAVNLGTSDIVLTGDRIVTVANNTSTIGGAISGAGRSLQLNGSGSTSSGIQLNGASTFDGGLIVAGVSGSALTASSGNASAFGVGQVNLTNSTNSRVSLGVDTTVGSLTSSINNSITSFTGGTSALAAGTYALTITGGGTGAAGTATVNSSGVVTAASITSLGVNYTSAPTITLASSSATFTPQTFGASSINLNPGVAHTLTIAGNNGSAATYAGVISGANGNLVKNGSGVQILTGTNTYTGTTTINQGTLLINGSTAAGSAFTVNNTGTLGGSGTVNGTVTVASGGTLSPGNSPGALTQGATTLDGGGNYNWQIVDATGLAGSGYDTINLTAGSTLTLNNTSGNTFKINLWSLSSIDPDVNGNATNFNSAGTYSWTLIDSDQTITNFAADKFTVNVSAANGTNGFTNALAGGSFSVALSGDQTDLVLNFTPVPEPSTWLLLAGTGTFFMVMRRRRRI